jgi:hypothetical protein
MMLFSAKVQHFPVGRGRRKHQNYATVLELLSERPAFVRPVSKPRGCTEYVYMQSMP